MPPEECSVCMVEQDISTYINWDAVCLECIYAGIVPKFLAALEHEAEYPPTWGRTRLSVWPFCDCMADPAKFLADYAKKELEYGTPLKERLYCGHCGAFCGRKDEQSPASLACHECKAIICSQCGVPNNHDGTHECEKPSDPFEGLVRGKEVQFCPNPSCGLPVELRDGCNAMLCVSSSCGWPFCFICGKRAEHDSDHWNAGSKCPRWNQPDSQDAQFDHPQPGILVEILLAQPRAPLDAAVVPDIIADIDHIDLGDDLNLLQVLLRVAAIIRAPFPTVGPQNTDLDRLDAESAMADELEATHMATLMRHQDDQLAALTQVADAMIQHHEAANRDIPAFLPAALDLFTALRLNLDMYIYRERLRDGLERYGRRHREIGQAFRGPHLRRFVQHFPMALRIIYTYFLVAEFCLGEAEGVQFDVAVRGGLVEFLRLLRRE